MTVSTGGRLEQNLIRTRIYDEYSGSMKITTHLDHISHCKTASGTYWSNRWTNRVATIGTCPDEISHRQVPARDFPPGATGSKRLALKTAFLEAARALVVEVPALTTHHPRPIFAHTTLPMIQNTILPWFPPCCPSTSAVAVPLQPAHSLHFAPTPFSSRPPPASLPSSFVPTPGVVGTLHRAECFN